MAVINAVADLDMRDLTAMFAQCQNPCPRIGDADSEKGKRAVLVSPIASGLLRQSDFPGPVLRRRSKTPRLQDASGVALDRRAAAEEYADPRVVRRCEAISSRGWTAPPAIISKRAVCFRTYEKTPVRGWTDWGLCVSARLISVNRYQNARGANWFRPEKASSTSSRSTVSAGNKCSEVALAATFTRENGGCNLSITVYGRPKLPPGSLSPKLIQEKRRPCVSWLWSF